MQRILAIALLITVAAMLLVGCGNVSLGLGTYTFTHAHISNGANGYCATVNSWHDNEIGCEMSTEEFGNIYCSEGTYFLIGNKENCPFCN